MYNTKTFYALKSTLIIVIVFGATHMISAQNCIISSNGIMTESNCNAGNTICTYTLDLCADVPASPAPKNITFTIVYDSDGNGVIDGNDASVSFNHDPPGSNPVPQGTFCLSDINEELVFNAVPNSPVQISVDGFTGNGAGSNCVTYITTSQASHNNVISDLPVELAYFQGRAFQGTIMLQWTTLSEINSSHFEIEKRTSSSDFKMIGAINSHHFSVDELNYRFEDDHPDYMNYYRLKMVDLDGSYEYSETIMIVNPDFEGNEINVFPNPVKSKGSISFSSSKEQNGVKLVVYSIQGEIIYKKDISLLKGINTISLEVDEWPVGNYLIQIRTPDGIFTEMLTKLKI